MDQKDDDTLKNLFVFHGRKSKFVILCHRDMIPPTNIPALSQKEISYFGPGKGLRYFIQENEARVISAYLWEYIVLLKKTSK